MAEEFSLTDDDWEFVPREKEVSQSLNLQNATHCKLLLRIHTDKFIKPDGVGSCWVIDDDNILTTKSTLDEIYQIIDETLAYHQFERKKDGFNKFMPLYSRISYQGLFESYAANISLHSITQINMKCVAKDLRTIVEEHDLVYVINNVSILFRRKIQQVGKAKPTKDAKRLAASKKNPIGAIVLDLVVDCAKIKAPKRAADAAGVGSSKKKHQKDIPRATHLVLEIGHCVGNVAGSFQIEKCDTVVIAVVPICQILNCDDRPLAKLRFYTLQAIFKSNSNVLLNHIGQLSRFYVREPNRKVINLAKAEINSSTRLGQLLDSLKVDAHAPPEGVFDANAADKFKTLRLNVC
jgi:hypothetical protein